MSDSVPLIALVGNPNTGKTTLFNRLTGQNTRVGNYPGITVERRVGTARLGEQRVEVLDVPGCYSLSARSPEERIAIDSLMGLRTAPPDLVVVVLDASNLVRNLYLALQILELGLPTVLALNMMDEVADNPPDADALAALLAVPVVPISARNRTGLEGLRHVLSYALRSPPRAIPAVPYPPAVEQAIAAVLPLLPARWQAGGRGMALWTLTSLSTVDEQTDVPEALQQAVRAQRAACDLDLEIVAARYAFLDAHSTALHRPQERTGSDRLDGVLMHPVWGFGVFVALMLTMFQALFSWADPMIRLVEASIDALAGLLGAVLPAGVLADLLIEGVLGGVGNVVVFLPQILLLFFFIGLLEDSGYMARAAYLMDRIMRALGLHGRAFVPMISGLACAVPAVMATRTMERQRDRLLTMMVIPLMTCSARLPVYTLIIAALFPPTEVFGLVPVQGLMMMAMYLFSTTVTLLAAAVLGRTVLKGERQPLLLELPPFRVPALSSTLRLMWRRARLFLSEAGSIILVCTVVLWGLLSYPKLPPPSPEGTESAQLAWQAESLEHSYAGRLGQAIEPVIAPLGFDWKIGVGLIGSFAAREVFVSTMGLVYGVGESVDEQSLSLREKMRAEQRPDGKPVYTPLVGLSLMVFFALACQCMSTLAIVKRESGGYVWPAFLFVYMTTMAWLCSFAVFQVGRLLGF